MPDEVSCKGCGACCMEMTAPPGMCGEEHIWFSTPEDEQRFADAPQEARDLIYTWADRVDALPDGAPLPRDEPCCWLDQETRTCRFHAFRPSVCREFEVGGLECLSWRDENPPARRRMRCTT